jgi:thioredoxin-like negative regulator of GroEL
LLQDPEDLTSKLCLAESLLGLGQYDKAMKELNVLIKAKPKVQNKIIFPQLC